jgi:uncharacterized protein YabN with tetrapyrrole methylase and pyrophosphatase domain
MHSKLLSSIIGICFLSIMSCNNRANKNTDSATNNDKTSVLDKVENISKMGQIAEASTARMEELKKLLPVSNEALKLFLKEEVAGIKRSAFSVQNTLGYTIGEATYKKNDSTEYKIMIYDCAGEMGSGFYSLMAMTKLNIETEDENGYEKTIDFMGAKALKSYKNYNEHYSLAFIAAERFWVQAEGDHTSFENLQAFINDIELTKLNGIK